MRTLRNSIAFTLALAVPTTALAQVPPPPTAAAPEAAPAEAEVFPPPEDAALPEDQKPEKAKELYIEAEGLVENGDWTGATPLYERAYYLVPGKHGFAYKVGIAAYNSTPRDCNKADDYLRHYIKYEDPNKHPDWIDEAKRILGEIAVSGCKVEEAAAPAETTTTTTEPEDTGPVTGEGPTFVTAEEERRQAAEAEAAQRDAGKRSGMFKGGIALAAIGGVALIGGTVTLVMSNQRTNQLADLSSSSLEHTNTGFPSGDWDCRVPGDPCPSDLDQQRKTLNGASYGLLIGGGVLAVTGVALIVVDNSKKKKKAASVTPVVGPGFTGASATMRF